MKQLLVVGRLGDDPKGVLTAVERLALVGIKLCGNVSLGIRGARLELCVTALTEANDRRWGYFHDPQFALVHDCSLAHRHGGRDACGNQAAPLRIAADLDIRHTFAYAPGMAITRRQRELYDFISRFVAEKQYSPSFEEIKEGMGLSSLATVHKHVTNLEKKGLLTRDYNRSRS